jgi:hypothetical protein
MACPGEGPTTAERELLARVRVRPIRAEERARWDALMQAHHYLGFSGMAGRALRQVAEAEGRWLALLGWHAAALMCAPRDRWIGWPRPLQFQRLHLIANNSRFLILPGVEIPHLASRVLGLSLRRLSADWQTRHGHPLLLAESFVDPARFRGTCYRAANWQCLGESRGFARSAGRYVHHGQPKTLWVYPLHRHARTWLCDPRPHPRWSHAMHTLRLSTAQLETLREHLRAIPDPRTARGRQHPLATVLSLALAATLAGARGYLAVTEFAQRLTQPQLKRLRAYYDRTQQRFLAPSEPTFRRALQRTDPNALEQAFGSWLAACAPATEPIAIDGKTLKGARRDNATQVHLLSALLHHQGSVLAQREVGEKTNEIPELRHLLADLDIAGRTVTADALHTQTETARFLVEDKQAHYLFTVKDNQPTLLEDLAAYHWPAIPPSGPDPG